MTPFWLNAQKWLDSAGWALADQGVFALSNFLVNVILARNLVPASFGIYSSAYSVFLFLGALHGGLFIEPLMVFSVSRYQDCIHDYIGEVISLHWTTTVPFGLAACCCAFGVDILLGTSIGKAALPFSFAGPCILLAWVVRRSCYVHGRPQRAAFSSMVYLIVTVAGLFALRSAHILTFPSAVAVMALSSLASAYTVTGLSVKHLRIGNLGVRDSHWAFGRWMALSAALVWFPLNWFFCVLPIWGSTEEAARLRAALILSMPAVQATIAFVSVAIPSLVAHRGNAHTFRAKHTLMTSMIIAAAVSYALTLLALGRPIAEAVFRGQYRLTQAQLLCLGLIAITYAASSSLAAGVKAQERPRRLIFANSVSAAVCLSIGTALVVHFRLAGALWGIILSQAACAACLLPALYRQQGLHTENAGARA